MLRCHCDGPGCGKDERWQVTRLCKGAKGCVPADDRNADCDGTIADEGDPCLDAPNAVGCARDGVTKLACANGKLAKSATCNPACTTKWTNEHEWTLSCPQ
jgi:hypothetical protein